MSTFYNLHTYSYSTSHLSSPALQQQFPQMVSFLLPLALYNLSSQNSRVTTLKYKSKLLLYSKPSKGCHFTLSENQSPCNGLQGAVIYASIPLKSHLSLPLLIDFISPIPESLMLLQIQEFFCLNACAHSVPLPRTHFLKMCILFPPSLLSGLFSNDTLSVKPSLDHPT